MSTVSLSCLPGIGFGFAQPPHFAAVAVDQRLPRSVRAHQQRVVLPLDAGNADHVARVVELELRLVQHVFADFADVADQVRHESVARIQAAVRHDRVEFRQLVAMRLDELQVRRA